MTPYNPVVQARRLAKLTQRIDNHQKDIATLSKSHDNHIYHLGNFARHDLKNAIQNMDSILSTTDPNQFDEDKISSMQRYLSIIRETMDNFAKLVPHSTNGKFRITELMVAVELLTRHEMASNKVIIKFDYPRDSVQEIELPFHALFQMMNNLLINSVRAQENIEHKKIEVSASIDILKLVIRITDNGLSIPNENKDVIFNYGFSTTGGSGIGLNHAKYLCDQFNGSIVVELTPQNEFTKIFTITIPVKKNGKEHSDN